MKLRLTHHRSTVTSVLLHPSVSFLSLVFVLAAFLTSMTHSKAIRGNDLDLSADLDLDQRNAVVEEFKAKILGHLGLNAPPTPGKALDTNGTSMVARRIREFMRKVELDELSDDDHFEEHRDVYEGLDTIVFHSIDDLVSVPIEPADTELSASSLKTLKFNTHLEQPEVPYHDLVIKSAILRMRINVFKNALRQKVQSLKKPLNVSVYLMKDDEEIQDTESISKHAFVRSFIVREEKSEPIEFDVESHLLSHVIDADDKTVTFGVTVAEAGSGEGTDNHEGEQPPDDSLALKTSRDLSIPKDLHSVTGVSVDIFDISLQVSVHTKDLRRSRRKRQSSRNTCSGRLCCRNSLYVSFEDIGWSDWVLAPEGYTAYFCKGGCPRRYKAASTFSGIKGLLHERLPDVVPEPSCAATGYRSLSLLHKDEVGNLVETDYPEMVVTGCRCY